MNRLRATHCDFSVYNAGYPHFLRNFSRDSLTSGMILGEAGSQDAALVLKEQLLFSAYKQGDKKNPHTGEEPGKIHHEFPGVLIEKLSTEYNACDTTALFLIAHRRYKELTGDSSLIIQQGRNIERAVEYISSHLSKGFFQESPAYCGANKLALGITYWKDSVIAGRKNGNPVYPVVYSLAHVLNLNAIRSAAAILDTSELKVLSEELAQVLPKLFDTELGGFYLAIDQSGPIKGVSSDSLHALFYLEQGDLTKEQLGSIAHSSEVLETPIGYRTLDPNISEPSNDPYHASTVWPFEQAIIHMGARKWGLKNVAAVSERIVSRLENSDHELFKIDTSGEIKEDGCKVQLWTIAAKRYLKEIKVKI